MKRLLLVGGLSFLLVACGGGEESSEVAVSSSELVESSIENQSLDTQESSDVKEYEDKINELEEKVSQLEEENSELSKSIEEMSSVSSLEQIEQSSESSEPVEEPNIGKRLNPFQFGDSMSIYGTDIFGNSFDLTLTLSNLITGEDARNRMISENQFNEISENEEVIFFDAELVLNEFKNKNDDPYRVSSYMFRYYRDDYSEYRSDNFVAHDNEFSGEMYEGGTQSGTVALIRPAGESGYIVFEDEIWIKLP